MALSNKDSPNESENDVEEENEESEVLEFAEEDFKVEEPEAEVLAEYEAKIKELQNAKDDLFDKYQRLQADFDNFRKRVAKERIEIINNTKKSLILSILEVTDNFGRAIESISHNPEMDPEILLEGVKMIQRQLDTLLKREGVELDSTEPGDIFDSSKHDAIERVDVSEEEDIPDHSIIEIIKKGYLFNSKILRATQVKVARIKKSKKEEPKKEELKKEDSKKPDSKKEQNK
ncbi:MAG: nucleotide exchange factor GrpE [Candidatus Hermodarchaeota archaeon]